MSDKLREQFEAWWPSVGQTIGKVAAWAAWLASRAAALEEAAKVCEGSVSIDETDEEWNDACEGCAHKIRALAGRGA